MMMMISVVHLFRTVLGSHYLSNVTIEIHNLLMTLLMMIKKYYQEFSNSKKLVLPASIGILLKIQVWELNLLSFEYRKR